MAFLDHVLICGKASRIATRTGDAVVGGEQFGNVVGYLDVGRNEDNELVTDPLDVGHQM